MLRTRPKDRRGYPIPYIVLIDKNKRPHFTINDQSRVYEVVKKKLCGLCGKKLDNGAWFIGGAKCFTSPLGAFIDPPVHKECGEYALKVCPFLAAPSYANRIDDKTLDPEATPGGTLIAEHDVDMPAEQPALFGFGQAVGYEVHYTGPGQFVMVPVDVPGRPGKWNRIEFWNDGAKLDDAAIVPRLQELGLIDRQEADG